MLSKSHVYYSHLFSRTLTWILALVSAAIATIGAALFLAIECALPLFALSISIATLHYSSFEQQA